MDSIHARHPSPALSICQPVGPPTPPLSPAPQTLSRACRLVPPLPRQIPVVPSVMTPNFRALSFRPPRLVRSLASPCPATPSSPVRVLANDRACARCIFAPCVISFAQPHFEKIGAKTGSLWPHRFPRPGCGLTRRWPVPR